MMNSLFEDLKEGLEEAIAYTSGAGEAKTYTVEVEPVKKYTHAEIKEVRITAHMTQAVFAKYMGVSIKTVEAWERGRTHPTGPACRLIYLLQTNKQPNFVKFSH